MSWMIGLILGGLVGLMAILGIGLALLSFAGFCASVVFTLFSGLFGPGVPRDGS